MNRGIWFFFMGLLVALVVILFTKNCNGFPVSVHPVIVEPHVSVTPHVMVEPHGSPSYAHEAESPIMTYHPIFNTVHPVVGSHSHSNWDAQDGSTDPTLLIIVLLSALVLVATGGFIWLCRT